MSVDLLIERRMLKRRSRSQLGEVTGLVDLHGKRAIHRQEQFVIGAIGLELL